MRLMNLSTKRADLLKEFPNSRAFWLIREYRNVAKSMMKKWTRKIGFDFLMKSSIEGTWQSEKINDLRPLLNSIKIKNLSNWDYTCLFWYVRNYHFYKQSLDTNNKVLLLHYDHLIRDLKYLQTRFDMLNLNLNISSDFYEQKSARTFKNINLNPLINQLCSDMWSRLNSDHKRSI